MTFVLEQALLKGLVPINCPSPQVHARHCAHRLQIHLSFSSLPCLSGCRKRGVIRGGVCKCERTRTHADIRPSEEGPKTQVKARNASKCRQTRTNAKSKNYMPFCGSPSVSPCSSVRPASPFAPLLSWSTERALHLSPHFKPSHGTVREK